MHPVYEALRPHAGLTYADYLARSRARLDVPLEGLDKQARRSLYYTRYNLERAERVEAQYEPSPGLCEAVDGLSAPQLWMVLTEDWCADSAFSLPVMVAVAARQPHVTLRVLPRDEHLDVMDAFLTHGARSIPKLVAFDHAGEVLFTWGPRPQEAVALRERMQAAGEEPREVTRALLAWYEAEGWRQVDVELTALLEAATAPQGVRS